jgi:hypothetical protein
MKTLHKTPPNQTKKIGWTLFRRDEENYRVTIVVNTDWKPDILSKYGKMLYGLEWHWQIVHINGHSLTKCQGRTTKQSNEITLNGLRLVVKAGTDLEFTVDHLVWLMDLTDGVWLDKGGIKLFNSILGDLQNNRINVAADKMRFIKGIEKPLIEKTTLDIPASFKIYNVPLIEKQAIVYPTPLEIENISILKELGVTT